MAFSTHQEKPSDQTNKALIKAKLKAQKAAKEIINAYFEDLASSIQMAVDKRNIQLYMINSYRTKLVQKRSTRET